MRALVDVYRVMTDMPVHWTADSQARLLSARIEGEVSLADVLAALDAMDGAGAMSFRKLADCRAGSTSMSPEEMLTLCVAIRSYHARGPMGALALVVTPAQSWLLARVMGVLAAADRPMRVFEDLRLARGWIKQQHDVPVDAEVSGGG